MQCALPQHASLAKFSREHARQTLCVQTLLQFQFTLRNDGGGNEGFFIDMETSL